MESTILTKGGRVNESKETRFAGDIASLLGSFGVTVTHIYTQQVEEPPHCGGGKYTIWIVLHDPVEMDKKKAAKYPAAVRKFQAERRERNMVIRPNNGLGSLEEIFDMPSVALVYEHKAE
jgi:hypothetical protein